MGLLLEEIRDEFLPDSARNKKVTSSPTQTDGPARMTASVATEGTPSLNETHIPEATNNEHNKTGVDDTVPTEEQLTLMNKHLSEMTDSTLRSVLRCLKSTNSSQEVQKLVVLRLGEISAEL